MHGTKGQPAERKQHHNHIRILKHVLKNFLYEAPVTSRNRNKEQYCGRI